MPRKPEEEKRANRLAYMEEYWTRPGVKERRREYERQYREMNHEGVLAAQQAWGVKNQEKRREYVRKYRKRQWEKLFGILGRKCVVCSGVKNLQRHHLDSRIEGRRAHITASEIERAKCGEVMILCRGCHLLISNTKRLYRQGNLDTFLNVLVESVRER